MPYHLEGLLGGLVTKDGDTWVVDGGPRAGFELVVGGDTARVTVDGRGAVHSFEQSE